MAETSAHVSAPRAERHSAFRADRKTGGRSKGTTRLVQNGSRAGRNMCWKAGCQRDHKRLRLLNMWARRGHTYHYLRSANDASTYLLLIRVDTVALGETLCSQAQGGQEGGNWPSPLVCVGYRHPYTLVYHMAVWESIIPNRVHDNTFYLNRESHA